MTTSPATFPHTYNGTPARMVAWGTVRRPGRRGAVPTPSVILKLATGPVVRVTGSALYGVDEAR